MYLWDIDEHHIYIMYIDYVSNVYLIDKYLKYVPT